MPRAMAPLVPCLVCKRHIRVDHVSCPFCGAAIPETFSAGIVPPARRRLDRVAMFTFALAFSGAACGQIADDGAPEQQGNQGVAAPAPDAGGHDFFDGGAPAPMYGASPYDAGSHPDAKAKPDARIEDAMAGDDGAIYVMYGIPPEDAGGPAPPYGVPPPDAGGPLPGYGAPPDAGW